MFARLQQDFHLAMLSLVGLIVFLCVTPYAVYRYWEGSYLVAYVDATLVVATSLAVLYAWLTGNTKGAGLFVASIFCVGVVLVVSSLGPVGLFWTYPFIIFVFFLVPPFRALLLLVLVLVTLLAWSAWLPGTIFDDRVQLTSFVVTATVTSFFSYVFAYRMLVQRRELESMAARDALTGAANRRELDLALEFAAGAGRRSRDKDIALLLLDLDFFKKINDEAGHQAGDQVLVNLVQLLQKHTRLSDQVYRFGGEEFVILLDDVEADEALAVAEKLRQRIAAELQSQTGAVSASIGVALLGPQEAWQSWLARADAALYRAKSGGRNQVVMAQAHTQ
ncbi:GGDEF domain-containing protein [Alkalimonas delamerensis]|uniref:diguanylate cyclase n=1 Tax=Alkalimonas delamerensis TaxID=265981 RepID=A0ABT9GRG9_9GAMM|nr:GGDEF domain-containing protein [Alkalimonas delamerensis]MDP4529479.1 GGDEF domain-containing protein [Alkalimonas delamerensis]